MSEKKPSFLQKIKREAWICLILMAVLLTGSLALHFTGDSDNELSGLNAQAATLTSALTQLETLETRFEKRVTQLEEAKTNLAASLEDAKLISKMERAQGEYDKALKNRDNQLAKVQAMPTMDELNARITELKEASAGRSLLANLLLAAAFICGCAAIAQMIRRLDVPVLIGMAILLAGCLLLVFGVHLNNLSPVLQPGETAPGTALLAAGLAITALGHVLYWCLLTRSKLNLKLGLGLVMIVGGAGLVISGFLDNNTPDAASRYINSMSPGFPHIFAGVILFVIGTVILAHPLTKIRYDIRKNPMLVIMVLPSVAYFLVTSYLPMVGVYFGFTSYQFTTDFFSTLFGSKFVGLSNFEYLFSSGLAWRMTANTLIYNFIFIVGGTILKVAIAIMFSEIAGKLYKKCVQTITFLPHFISMVMVGTFAYNLLNYNSGVINSFLTALGFDRMDFYSMPGAWYVILPLVDFWKGVGYGSIIYVSAITGISDDLYEAADLDGANFMQEIVHITIPSIRPTIVILTLMSLGSIMKGNFDLFYQLVGESGQLMETTEIIDTYVWRALRQNVQIGMGSAAGLYQSFVGMILVVLVNTIVKKIEPDYAIF